ncbi:MAG: hypothetical protein ACRC7O_13265 [Fimbriiglobus sp.]
MGGVLGAVVVAFVVAFAVSFWATSAHVPHGIEDAISIWNLRARFLFRGGDDLPTVFDPVNWHTDYPLMVPATVARCWTYAGADRPGLGAVVAFAFAVNTAGLVGAGLSVLRGPGVGVLGAAGVLAHGYYHEVAVSQLADIPMAFYVLAGAVVIAVRDADPGGSGPRAGLGLAGAMIGLAGWTKNEGLLVAAAMAVAYGLTTGRGRWRELPRDWLGLAAGVVPFWAAVAVLKFGFAPENDLVAAQAGGAVGSRLGNTLRHLIIVQSLLSELISVGPGLILAFAGYAFLLGVRLGFRPARLWFLPTALGLTAAGYYYAYVTTPHDLRWHLDASLGRLIVQLWPAAVFGLLTVTATPAEARRWNLDSPGDADGPPRSG